MKPLLIIINGLPGSGKTTLVEKLAKDLSLPFFRKDQIKETLFDMLGVKDRAWSTELGKASMALLFQNAEILLGASESCMIEGNFNPHFGQLDIVALQEKSPCDLFQIFCQVSAPVRIQRLLRRVKDESRHVGHGEPKEYTEEEYIALLHQELDPMDLDAPLVTYDSGMDEEDGYNTLLVKVRSCL